MELLQGLPWWLVLAAIVVLAAVVIALWRSRYSLNDLDRRGFPTVEPRDRSARSGPQRRTREWLDPNATGREHERRDSSNTDR